MPAVSADGAALQLKHHTDTSDVTTASTSSVLDHRPCESPVLSLIAFTQIYRHVDSTYYHLQSWYLRSRCEWMSSVPAVEKRN